MGTTTSNPPPVWLLDLTRLIRRAGRPFTGVDRVEKAYLDHLLGRREPLFALIRSAFGYILLDRDGCTEINRRLSTGVFGEADRLSRLRRSMDPMRARAEADLRRICLDRCLPRRLGRMLRRHLPGCIRYFNVGHTNLSGRVLAELARLGAHVSVMVHDTIPLDFPEYQRPQTTRAFAGFFARAAQHADVILCNSVQTRDAVARHAAPLEPETLVAHLGVPVPNVGPAPHGPWEGHPYFVCIGTIEPRKNHGFLLDLWEEIEDAHLLICGNRGWRNEAVFQRLDRKPVRVHELNSFEDDALFGLLAASKGLLFPSLVEGYGLPPIEAAALGVPVLCNDLAIYREVLGDIPVYGSVADRYLWRNEINRLAYSDRSENAGGVYGKSGWKPPTWDAHFKTVLRMI